MHVAAIREGYADAVQNHRIEEDGHFDGRSRSGVRIDGYLNPDGKSINTAYPVYSRR